MASKLISRRMISVCATDPRQPLTFYSNASSTKKKGKVFSPIFQSTFHVFTHFLKAKSLTLFFLGLIYPMLSLINEIFRDFPIKDFGDPPPSKSDKTHYWTFIANLCGRHRLFCVRAPLRAQGSFVTFLGGGGGVPKVYSRKDPGFSSTLSLNSTLYKCK